MFPPELRTAAFVPRWSIIWTLKQDTIASHSYFVAIYARLIAKLIGWTGPKDYLLLNALAHDLDESVTGDITGPTKKFVLDHESSYVDDLMRQRMAGVVLLMEEEESNLNDEAIDEAYAIVKCADVLDALFYLITEERLGNKVVADPIVKVQASLEGVWRSLPADSKSLSRLWQTEILPAIANHRTQGGQGV